MRWGIKPLAMALLACLLYVIRLTYIDLAVLSFVRCQDTSLNSDEEIFAHYL
jgi:hypothetical protein